MSLSTFDVAVAVFIVVTMPLLMWVNYSVRDGGVQGYLWRESPLLMWLSLVFLGVIFLYALAELLAYFGVLSPAREEQFSVLVGIPMLVLSLANIWLGIAAWVRYRRTPPAA